MKSLAAKAERETIGLIDGIFGKMRRYQTFVRLGRWLSADRLIGASSTNNVPGPLTVGRNSNMRGHPWSAMSRLE